MSSHKSRYIIYGILYAALLPPAVYFNRQFLIELYMRHKIAHEQIIVSLTTTPNRIDKIQNTLDTILRQNIKIQTIYINIPYKLARNNEEYKIPPWLQLLDDEKKIKILRTKDYGPATKLLGLLEQKKLPPETIIITVDDDVYYPDNLVLQLAYRSSRNPNYAIGISGVDPDYDSLGKININSYMGLIHKYDKDDFVTILQGYGGIAYRASFFGNDIFKIQSSNPSCILADDIYISFYLAKNNIQRRALKNDFISVYDIHWLNDIGTGTDALHLQTPKPAFKHKECIEFLKLNNHEVIF